MIVLCCFVCIVVRFDVCIHEHVHVQWISVDYFIVVFSYSFVKRKKNHFFVDHAIWKSEKIINTEIDLYNEHVLYCLHCILYKVID